MSLELDNLRVNYGTTRALDGVSVKIEPGEMFFLLGPSGCGKSTLLRAVAGFLESFEGDIRIEGQSLKGLPPHQRDFGMVFQNYALFPHLNVAGNVSFGLEARKLSATERASRVASALEMVGLKGYEARHPGELSGGQQQRVALARALVIKPRLLLLDEPLSNLDAKLRYEMREELRRIHSQTKLTTLYVTHDQKEALALADRMAILKNGQIDALGAPRDLYCHPPTAFSATFLGDANELPGTVSADGQSLQTALGPLHFNTTFLPKSALSGTVASAFCRPENVQIAPEIAKPLSAEETIFQVSGQIASVAFLGEHTLYEVALPNQLRWHVLRNENGSSGLPNGSAVRLSVVRDAWAITPPDA